MASSRPELVLPLKNSNCEGTGYFMSALCEGGDPSDGWPVACPFAETEFLRVAHCVHFSCSSDVTAGSAVEVRFGRSGNSPSTHEIVESVSHFSKRSGGIGDDIWLCIGRIVDAVCERCFYDCKNLRWVIFGGLSKVECFCAEAFRGMFIESLSIPDSVVVIGPRCFYECASLRRVIFGASSKLERICVEAFIGTRIESLSIPDSVVDIGWRSCYECKSLRSVSFGGSSRLERMYADAFCGTSIESLYIPDSVIGVGRWCFCDCKNLRSVIFGGSLKLERFCENAFIWTGIESL